MSYLFWDGIIVSYLVINLIAILYCLKREYYTLSTIGFFAFGFICYGSFIEPHLIVYRHETTTITQNPTAQKTIALLSDLHLGPYKKKGFTKRVIKKTLKQQPDMVLLLGDFVYKGDDQAEHLALFSELSNQIPVYAVMGNHDYDLYSAVAPVDMELGETIQTVLKEAGVQVLQNQGQLIENLYIAGIDDYWSRNVQLDKALEQRIAPTQPTILLSHNPDIIQDILPEHGINLVLSGHTHGGQIRLPLLGPIGTIPTMLGQAYDQGFFTTPPPPLFITSGVGESGPRARLFNPPEIVLLTVSY